MEDDIYDVKNYPMSSIKTMDKIISQMKRTICNISANNKGKGTGFFCNINYDDWEILRVLITTNNVLDKFDISPGQKIKISLNDGEISKEILIDGKRKTYISQEYGITIIEIKSTDGLKLDSFLDIDEVINDENPKKNLQNLPIYLLHYPKGDEIRKSENLIRKLSEDNYSIEHLCRCDLNSSGGPLINFNNNKVIGINKGFGNGKKGILEFLLKIQRSNKK